MARVVAIRIPGRMRSTASPSRTTADRFVGSSGRHSWEGTNIACGGGEVPKFQPLRRGDSPTPSGIDDDRTKARTTIRTRSRGRCRGGGRGVAERAPRGPRRCRGGMRRRRSRERWVRQPSKKHAPWRSMRCADGGSRSRTRRGIAGVGRAWMPSIESFGAALTDPAVDATRKPGNCGNDSSQEDSEQGWLYPGSMHRRALICAFASYRSIGVGRRTVAVSDAALIGD